MRCLNTVLQDILVGKKAVIVKSRNPSYLNLSGTIIDETKETITIDDGVKRRMIIKRGTIFHVTLPDGTVLEIDGNMLVGRPEDRIKRRLRRRW